LLLEAEAGSKLRVRDLAGGKPSPAIQPPGDAVAFALSEDGALLAVGTREGGVTLWEVGTGRLRARLRGHVDEVFAVAFRPGGQTLASGSRDGIIKLWDVETGQERASFQGHREPVFRLCFSPDGRFLASASGDRTVKLGEGAALPKPARSAGAGRPIPAPALRAGGITSSRPYRGPGS
jgi:WD40 repeat protein